MIDTALHEGLERMKTLARDDQAFFGLLPVERLVQEFFATAKNTGVRGSFDVSLLSFDKFQKDLKALMLDEWSDNRAFMQLVLLAEHAKSEMERDGEDTWMISDFILTTKQIGVLYFQERVIEELRPLDLPARSRYCSEKIRQSTHMPFLLGALQEAYETARNKISDAKQERQDRIDLGLDPPTLSEAETSPNNIFPTEISEETKLKLDESVALESGRRPKLTVMQTIYLLQKTAHIFNDRVTENTKKAKVIEALTGFSSGQVRKKYSRFDCDFLNSNIGKEALDRAEVDELLQNIFS